MHRLRLIYNTDGNKWNAIDVYTVDIIDTSSQEAIIDDLCQKFLIDACIKRIDDEKTVKDSTSNKIVILYSVSTWINNMRTLGGTMDDSQLLGIYRFTFSNNIRLQMIYYKSNDDTSNMVNGITEISYFIVIWVILSIFMSSLIDLLIGKNWYKYVHLSMHQLFTKWQLEYQATCSRIYFTQD